VLPKQERLLKKREFDRVFRLKRSVASPCIVAYIMPSKAFQEQQLPKTGFIVGKKIHKKATKRNKIKRRMREAYRIIRAEKPERIKNFHSIIFIARPSILGKEYPEIYENILICLKKAEKLV
jgi:ribonuclease P protein component